MNPRVRIGLWWLMWVLALGVAAASSRYFSLNPAVFFPEQVEVYTAHPVALLMHAGGGMVALVLGPWLLRTGPRAPRWPWHRRLGTVYFVAIAVGASGGVMLALMAFGGGSAQAGFFGLNLVWVVTAVQGWRHIRARSHAVHRAWMYRNYALTFAAVTLRLWFPLLELAGMPHVDAYRTVAWLCWVPNLLLVEWRLSSLPWANWRPESAAGK